MAQQRAGSLSCFAGLAPSVKPLADVKDELGLGDGRTNQNFIVRAAEKDYFVRISSDLPAFGVTRVREHAASRAAADAGVGPPVHYTELPDAMVLDFVKGPALTETDVRTSCQEEKSLLFELIVSALRKMHTTPVPAAMMGGQRSWAPQDLALWIEYARTKGWDRLPLLAGTACHLAACNVAGICRRVNRPVIE